MYDMHHGFNLPYLDAPGQENTKMGNYERQVLAI